MLKVGDELIGVSGNPYSLTGEGKRVIILSVRETEKDPIFLQKYKYGSYPSDDLIIALIEDSKNQHFQFIREDTIIYLEQALKGVPFLYRKNTPEPYMVNSKYFKLCKRAKQTSILPFLGSKLVEKER